MAATRASVRADKARLLRTARGERALAGHAHASATRRAAADLSAFLTRSPRAQMEVCAVRLRSALLRIASACSGAGVTLTARLRTAFNCGAPLASLPCRRRALVVRGPVLGAAARSSQGLRVSAWPWRRLTQPHLLARVRAPQQHTLRDTTGKDGVSNAQPGAGGSRAELASMRVWHALAYAQLCTAAAALCRRSSASPARPCSSRCTTAYAARCRQP